MFVTYYVYVAGGYLLVTISWNLTRMKVIIDTLKIYLLTTSAHVSYISFATATLI